MATVKCSYMYCDDIRGDACTVILYCGPVPSGDAAAAGAAAAGPEKGPQRKQHEMFGIRL